MTLEEQMERIKSRHDGNDNAVQMMKVLQYFRKVFLMQQKKIDTPVRHFKHVSVNYVPQAFFEFCEPAGSDEPNTTGITVTPGMSPEDVLKKILQGNVKEQNTHL